MKAINLEKMLPADIPRGEKILWLGTSALGEFRAARLSGRLCRRVFRRVGRMELHVVGRELGLVRRDVVGAKTLGLGAAALALLAMLAWLGARTTLYVITRAVW